jgi:hypothetical protein
VIHAHIADPALESVFGDGMNGDWDVALGESLAVDSSTMLLKGLSRRMMCEIFRLDVLGGGWLGS